MDIPELLFRKAIFWRVVRALVGIMVSVDLTLVSGSYNLGAAKGG